MPSTGTTSCQIHRISPGHFGSLKDQLVEESPLEIRLEYGHKTQRRRLPLAVTMRTPGQDEELTLGFLFTEAIIGDIRQVLEVETLPALNRVTIFLDPAVKVDPSRLDRHFYTTSSCGVCGKGALEMVEAVSCYFPQPGYPQIPAEVLCGLAQKLRADQSLFELTGGIHAAGLFNASGELLLLREDVGRHNAVDKLIGACLRERSLPLREHLLVLSGRIGFELVQKATMAGIPVIAAVGAPTSLAVELAEANDMTLVGFLRDDRMNVYCGIERIISGRFADGR
ncbi:MAG: formate dehydrogenase accessory sulfurtransferase FdhD [Saprospiraceae bacterium]|nr:formate dehydrogenase accessory sulfurtransferase FdhD [Lewinella sp.]